MFYLNNYKTLIIRRLLFLLLITYLLNACTKPSLEDYKLLELNKTFELLLDNLRNKNEELLEHLKKSVTKSGNTEAGRADIQRAEDLKYQTAELLGHLDFIKQQLKADSNQHKLQKILFGALGNRLVQKMDSVQAFLQNKFKDLEIKSSDFIHLSNAKKDYLQENFADVSLAEALVLLSEKQIQVMRSEQAVLGKFSYTFNEIETVFPLISAKSKWVKAGEIYQAEVNLLRFTKLTKANRPKIKINDQEIPVNELGIGELRFKTQRLGKQTWRGNISFSNLGQDTPLVFKKDYYVIPK